MHTCGNCWRCWQDPVRLTGSHFPVEARQSKCACTNASSLNARGRPTNSRVELALKQSIYVRAGKHPNDKFRQMELQKNSIVRNALSNNFGPRGCRPKSNLCLGHEI